MVSLVRGAPGVPARPMLERGSREGMCVVKHSSKTSVVGDGTEKSVDLSELGPCTFLPLSTFSIFSLEPLKCYI